MTDLNRRELLAGAAIAGAATALTSLGTPALPLPPEASICAPASSVITGATM